jgi:hypothetical protein
MLCGRGAWEMPFLMMLLSEVGEEASIARKLAIPACLGLVRCSSCCSESDVQPIGTPRVGRT